MSIQTYLKGRLRNTSLPTVSGLYPLFESVINSVHAIEETKSNNGKIKIQIIRDSQKDLFEKNNGRDSVHKNKIIGFKITDNGVGFNEENMKSFRTLDSDYKIEKGCRGVGRLLWLKAFKIVKISSTFKDKSDQVRHRTFIFNEDVGDTNQELSLVKNDQPIQTTVHLDNFYEKYQVSTPKNIDAIANKLLEHCLWYFVREGGAPNIIISDENDSINLDELYEKYIIDSAQRETIKIKNESFELTHLKLRSNISKTHSLSLCAANRLVKQESINGKIPGLFGRIKDDSGEFIYSCYVTSSFLDNRVRSERTNFDIEEEVGDLLKEVEITKTDINNAIMKQVSSFLDNYLKENRENGKQRIENFVAKKAPKYRSILKRIPEENLYVDPNISDKDLDLALHGHFYKIESDLLSNGHDIMNPNEDENLVEYQERLNNYLKLASDIKRSDLANYISHRKVILDILEKAIKTDEKGNVAREELIHNLIMPLGKDSNEIMFDDCNLWLLDERLAFHDYLGSDKTLRSIPITDASDTKEPDICGLNVFDNPILVSDDNKLPLASIVVIELKRPLRNDASEGEEKDPIEQALGYLNRIRQGKVKTSSQRPIPESENIPGFCYVICDLTPSIKTRCDFHDATLTSDGLGYFFYHKKFKAYVEVVSYDRLVNSAKERNRSFFDKLGLPTN